MIREFHMSLPYVLDELPLNQAFALAAFHAETDGRLVSQTDGYIAQERNKLQTQWPTAS